MRYAGERTVRPGEEGNGKGKSKGEVEGSELNVRCGQKMQEQANSLAFHISNLTFELKVVDRMVLNFKCDKNGQLWFLWCSGLRLKVEEQTC